MDMFTSQEQIELIQFIQENAININENILNESVQLKMSDKILDKMFALTVGKYNKVDFGEIEKSKGDFTKFKYYDMLNNCITKLKEISDVTNHFYEVETISLAFSNMTKLKRAFESGFRENNVYVMMIYNIIGYAIFEATSFSIASSIEFIKSGEEYEVDVSSSNVTRKNLMISSLDKFNKSVSNGTLLKYAGKSHELVNQAEPLQESWQIPHILRNIIPFDKIALQAYAHPLIATSAVVATAIMLIYLGAHIIPFLREIVYMFYNIKHTISESAAIQADFLEANVEVLKANGGSEKVIAKQTKVIERFRNIARKYALDYDKTDNQTKRELQTEKIDVEADDIVI